MLVEIPIVHQSVTGFAFQKGPHCSAPERMGIVAGVTNLDFILQSLSGPGNVWNPGIFADICARLRNEAAIADCMAGRGIRTPVALSG
jgi:hypothetical protein